MMKEDKTSMGEDLNYSIEKLTNQYSEYEFYGVVGNHFKIGNVIFEAVEDESDGYRSYLDSVVLEQDSKFLDKIRPRFNRRPIAKVKIAASSEEVDIVDAKTGFIWLSIFTDNMDDYYPCFTFDYSVPETEAEYNEDIQNLSPELIDAEYWLWVSFHSSLNYLIEKEP